MGHHRAKSQFTNLNDLWNAIEEVSGSITSTEISNLTSSVDQRLNCFNPKE